MTDPRAPQDEERCCPPPSGWERRYLEGSTPWDLGRAPPALELLLPRLAPGQRVLVPGAGHGHDALALARAGHHVTAIDIAPTAVHLCRERARAAGLVLDARVGDVLDPPQDLVGAFDAAWEQTCFCALEPAQRGAYVDAMARLLASDGRYHGLFWNHGQPGGPPFDVTEALVRETFAPSFEIEAVEPVPSLPPRSREILVTMRPRARQAAT